MIDTVTLWMPEVLPPAGAGALSDVREEYDHQSEQVTFRGNLDNLHVKARCDGFSVFGSLHKYVSGCNLHRIGRQDVEAGISKLSETLQMPLYEANVYRLDVALQVKGPVSEYLSVCGTASRYERDQFGSNGLIYRNGRRALLYTTSLLRWRRSSRLSRCR